jgi:hypothetical protein
MSAVQNPEIHAAIHHAEAHHTIKSIGTFYKHHKIIIIASIVIAILCIVGLIIGIVVYLKYLRKDPKNPDNDENS